MVSIGGKALARSGVVLALFVVGLLVASPSAQAISFDLTSDHCTGGCGTPPFGTVTLTQNGTTVDITVALAAGYQFVKTGSADFQSFKFNGVGVALGDITVDAHVPALAAAQAASPGGFNGDGTGNFDFGINCPSCSNGGSGAFSNAISFHVANASIADLIHTNNLNIVFVADVLAPNGNTGPIDVTTNPNPPPASEPGTMLLLGSGLTGLVVCRRLRSRG
jgi:hypothetical protein